MSKPDRYQIINQVTDEISRMAAAGEIAGIAFAVVRPDGVPVVGHAMASYELLGAVTMCQAALSSKLMRATTDAEGFPDDEGLT